MPTDLTEQILEAVDNVILNENDQQKIAFLKYLNEDLKTQATLASITSILPLG